MRDAAGEAVASAFERAILEGEELSNVFKALAQDLAKMIFQRMVFDQIAGAVSGGLGSIFSGGKALGGAVHAGSAYRVGESGPEVFVPRVPGSIVPRAKMGGGGVTIDSTVNAAPAPTAPSCKPCSTSATPISCGGSRASWSTSNGAMRSRGRSRWRSPIRSLSRTDRRRRGSRSSRRRSRPSRKAPGPRRNRSNLTRAKCGRSRSTSRDGRRRRAKLAFAAPRARRSVRHLPLWQPEKMKQPRSDRGCGPSSQTRAGQVGRELAISRLTCERSDPRRRRSPDRRGISLEALHGHPGRNGERLRRGRAADVWPRPPGTTTTASRQRSRPRAPRGVFASRRRRSRCRLSRSVTGFPCSLSRRSNDTHDRRSDAGRACAISARAVLRRARLRLGIYPNVVGRRADLLDGQDMDRWRQLLEVSSIEERRPSRRPPRRSRSRASRPTLVSVAVAILPGPAGPDLATDF